jgi:hypothetical protein
LQGWNYEEQQRKYNEDEKNILKKSRTYGEEQTLLKNSRVHILQKIEEY